MTFSRHPNLWTFLAVAVMLGSLYGDEMPARSPWLPASTGEASWLRRMAAQQGELTNGRFDAVFIGDSLTEFWTHTGKASWASLAPLKCMNCGVAGDRTEHILFRIGHLDFRRAAPKVFVLLMGTNNLGMESPDRPQDVAQAIIGAAETLSRRHPQSRILILEITPSGYEPASALRQSIREINALLGKAKLPTRASLVPLYASFVDEADRWKPGLTLDGTHFSGEGYAELARIIAPYLKP
jgi:lysophospholipase L1-like esterase